VVFHEENVEGERVESVRGEGKGEEGVEEMEGMTVKSEDVLRKSLRIFLTIIDLNQLFV